MSDLETPRALITGAEGFVGKVLRPLLEEAGWETVRSDLEGADGAIACDITRAEDIHALLDAAGPVTHLFHLAAVTFVPTSTRDPAPTIEANLIGTMRLTQALVERESAARLIFIGSAEIYGPPQSLPVDESHLLNPQNPYAISKAAADDYLRFVGRTTKLDIVRMRPFNHSGPGQSPLFVLPGFARQIAEIEAGLKEPILHVGNLEAARDFLHVRDVTRAYLLAAQRGGSGRAYNVCSGESHRIQEALDLMLARSDAKITVRRDPARMRKVDVPEVRGDHGRLTETCGWTPEIPFETLLDELLEHWRGAVARAGAAREASEA